MIGAREVIGVSVELSETEVQWRKFLQGMDERGLHGIQLIVSYDHAGLKAARVSTFPSLPWQRCQFHLQRNAGNLVAIAEQKAPLAEALRSVFNAADAPEASRLLEKLTRTHEKLLQSALRGFLETFLKDWRSLSSLKDTSADSGPVI